MHSLVHCHLASKTYHNHQGRHKSPTEQNHKAGAYLPGRRCGWYLHSQERIHFQKKGETQSTYKSSVPLSACRRARARTHTHPHPEALQRPSAEGQGAIRSSAPGDCAGKSPGCTGPPAVSRSLCSHPLWPFTGFRAPLLQRSEVTAVAPT